MSEQDRQIPEAVTRIDVNHGSLHREFWADEWDVYVQDEGRTVKLFAKGGGTVAKQARDQALAEFMSQGWDNGEEEE